MLLAIITGFITVRLLDVIDILLVAWLMYEVYLLMRGSVAIKIFLGITAVYIIWKIVSALEMVLLGEILGQFVSVGMIALIVVFQREIRQFLLLLGTPRIVKRPGKWLKFLKIEVGSSSHLDSDVLIKSCNSLTASQTGGLIIITRKNDLEEYIKTGEVIDSLISEQLIENIFFKNSPLHDGAIIITRNRIKAAGCVLPLSRSEDFPAGYGLRHRAAVGISEQSDAIGIVISEQTGELAYSKGGTLFTKMKPEAIKNFLEEEFN